MIFDLTKLSECLKIFVNLRENYPDVSKIQIFSFYMIRINNDVLFYSFLNYLFWNQIFNQQSIESNLIWDLFYFIWKSKD